MSNGTVRCWGYNAEGQLGNGTTTSSPTPVVVSGLGGVSALAGGYQHTCALRTGGTVRCWGRNFAGQLGDGTTTDSSVPVAVAGLSGVTAISVGFAHSCALLSDSTVRCWGANGSGQLGNGTTVDSPAPVAVSGLSGVATLGQGSSSSHTCVVLGDGTGRCWGYNFFGQLGIGSWGLPETTPMVVSGLSGAVDISTGGGHTCAVLGDGTGRCWGLNHDSLGVNSAGALGDGTTVDSYVPVAVSGLASGVVLAAGSSHTCAALGDDSAACWGNNDTGQVGDGTTSDALVPVAVSTSSDVVDISPGGAHTCAVRGDGTVWCWGWNGVAQLGDGTSVDSSVPVKVVGIG
jgi:alpha-tubulin suppressor-like RCC1 family protein